MQNIERKKKKIQKPNYAEEEEEAENEGAEWKKCRERVVMMRNEDEER